MDKLTRLVFLIGIMLMAAAPVMATTYCGGMGVLAELSAKMRDRGLSENQTLMELKKMSPEKNITNDVADLVSAAYMESGRNMPPRKFRSFFESFCQSNGFDRSL